MNPREPVVEAFADLTRSLVGEFDLSEALDRIIGHALAACGAAGVGLVVKDAHQFLRDIAYTDERVRRLERRQVAIGEGPCVDCVRTGEPVVTWDLAADRARWPRFAPAAAEAGFTGVRALPLRHRHRTLGALNLFDQDGGPGSDEALRTAQAFADLTVLAVLQHAVPRERVAADIAGALRDRSVIERAKGMLAQDAGTTPGHAFALLQAHAARAGQGTTTLARALVGGSVTTAEVLAGQHPRVR